MKKFIFGLIALVVLGFIIPKVVAAVLAAIVAVVVVVCIVACALLPLYLTSGTDSRKERGD